MPKKDVEKQRLYEWFIEMFKEEIPKIEFVTKDGYELIKTLKKKLVTML